MPPRRYKVNHHKEKGSSYAGFLDRNAEVLPEHMLKKRNQARVIDPDSESGSEDGEVDQVKTTVSKQPPPEVRQSRGSDSDNSDDQEEVALEAEFGRPGLQVGESRKEREARQAEEARIRYQEMHLAGKTAEAKADLARLAEVRRRREEAAQRAKKDKEDKETSKTRGRNVSHPNRDVVREAFM